MSEPESIRVNTNQQESDTNQHESDTNQHKSTRVQHESDTNQHESTRVRNKSTHIDISKKVKKSPRRVNVSQQKSDMSLTRF